MEYLDGPGNKCGLHPDYMLHECWQKGEGQTTLHSKNAKHAYIFVLEAYGLKNKAIPIEVLYPDIFGIYLLTGKADMQAQTGEPNLLTLQKKTYSYSYCRLGDYTITPLTDEMVIMGFATQNKWFKRYKNKELRTFKSLLAAGDQLDKGWVHLGQLPLGSEMEGELYILAHMPKVAGIKMDGEVYRPVTSLIQQAHEQLSHKPQVSEKVLAVVNAIRHTIDRLIEQGISPVIGDLLKHKAYNQQDLNKCHKQVYQDTFKGYATTVQMNLAKSYLESGLYKVAEVGYKVGFKDASSFERAFKKYFGVLPVDILKNNAEKADIQSRIFVNK
ncbi:AraC-type DNA-binding protein [bacterium A37T11]|nr:AraC-type DNA-binding protein [bacterium A37T11]